MKILAQKEAVEFHGAKGLAGRLVLDDRFKPYVCPLRTPEGHDVTLRMPCDHRHHKGSMYALRCVDLNFWEEEDGKADCGVERVVGRRMLENGVELDLHWARQDGALATYDEVRTLRCREVPERRSYVWTWTSQRTALRDHQLIQSGWTIALPDGRKINYHGLGIRLPWSWAFGGNSFNGTEIDGAASAPEDAVGTTVKEVAMWGLIDGHWSPPCARVALRQNHGFAWFVLKGDFAYLAAGPTAAGPLDVRAGQTFAETYEIEVSDITPPTRA
jgi:hypothetical protein